MGRKKEIMSVWEVYGKEIIRLVGMGGKWEGNYDIYWPCKEMGRKKILVLVGEGNGKENNNFVDVGRKKEGKNGINCPKPLQNHTKNRQKLDKMPENATKYLKIGSFCHH